MIWMRPDNVAFFLTCSFLPYLVVCCSSPGAGRRFPSCGTVGAGALHFQGGWGDCACSQGGSAVFNPHATVVSCLCLWGRHGPGYLQPSTGWSWCGKKLCVLTLCCQRRPKVQPGLGEGACSDLWQGSQWWQVGGLAARSLSLLACVISLPSWDWSLPMLECSSALEVCFWLSLEDFYGQHSRRCRKRLLP